MADKKDFYLITLNYEHSMNAFEEYYRESISYSEIEQISYIDFKTMFFEMVNKNVKFRKHERINKHLILKAKMSKKNYELFKELNEKKEFKFIHDFEISNIRLFTKNDQDNE